ncbi:MAG: response regulator, partial [bacterium]|nr:response regulator [bacterium]
MPLGKILVVDDEESMCQYLSILLQKEGYDVQTANSGTSALKVMESGPVDLVMTDIQMPKMDGIELLKSIKKSEPTTPVIIMTAYASEQSAIDAVNLGAFSYLQKHCKNDEI